MTGAAAPASQLQVRGLQLALAPGQATRVSVAETVLSDYFARVIIDETGRINLQGLVKGADAAPATRPACWRLVGG